MVVGEVLNEVSMVPIDWRWLRYNSNPICQVNSGGGRVKRKIAHAKRPSLFRNSVVAWIGSRRYMIHWDTCWGSCRGILV